MKDFNVEKEIKNYVSTKKHKIIALFYKLFPKKSLNKYIQKINKKYKKIINIAVQQINQKKGGKSRKKGGQITNYSLDNTIYDALIFLCILIILMGLAVKIYITMYPIRNDLIVLMDTIQENEERLSRLLRLFQNYYYHHEDEYHSQESVFYLNETYDLCSSRENIIWVVKSFIGMPSENVIECQAEIIEFFSDINENNTPLMAQNIESIPEGIIIPYGDNIFEWEQEEEEEEIPFVGGKKQKKTKRYNKKYERKNKKTKKR
jgi:hypothetical protein